MLYKLYIFMCIYGDSDKIIFQKFSRFFLSYMSSPCGY